MSTQFSAGDIVQLKSGGPVMTVNSTRDQNGGQVVFVSWFTDTGKLEHAQFKAEAVKKTDG